MSHPIAAWPQRDIQTFLLFSGMGRHGYVNMSTLPTTSTTPNYATLTPTRPILQGELRHYKTMLPIQVDFFGNTERTHATSSALKIMAYDFRLKVRRHEAQIMLGWDETQILFCFAEDLGSNPGAGRNFYFGLQINFLHQFL